MSATRRTAWVESPWSGGEHKLGEHSMAKDEAKSAGAAWLRTIAKGRGWRLTGVRSRVHRGHLEWLVSAQPTHGGLIG
jgi:hypothetical protein